MQQQNNIQVFDTSEALSSGTAAFIIQLAGEAIAARGRFVISLSGGHTPEHLFALLATADYREKIPWENTFVFWGDERCVPFDDKDNNARMAMSLMLDKIKIPAQNINRIPVDLPPAEAALSYEQTMKKFFGAGTPSFDLMLLGLGANGHTASLFPGTDVINEKKHWVKEVYVEEQKAYRITLTLPVINSSRNILFLTEGESKAAILKQVLTPTGSTTYPAELVKPVNGRQYWFMDKNAAKEIQ